MSCIKLEHVVYHRSFDGISRVQTPHYIKNSHTHISRIAVRYPVHAAPNDMIMPCPKRARHFHKFVSTSGLQDLPTQKRGQQSSTHHSITERVTRRCPSDRKGDTPRPLALPLTSTNLIQYIIIHLGIYNYKVCIYTNKLMKTKVDILLGRVPCRPGVSINITTMEIKYESCKKEYMMCLPSSTFKDALALSFGAHAALSHMQEGSKPFFIIMRSFVAVKGPATPSLGPPIHLGLLLMTRTRASTRPHRIPIRSAYLQAPVPLQFPHQQPHLLRNHKLNKQTYEHRASNAKSIACSWSCVECVCVFALEDSNWVEAEQSGRI